MDSKFVEIYPGKNLLPTAKKADKADNFFIGGNKKLLQWSISLQKMTKDYGNIMAGIIFSMVQTSDKKYLFLSDGVGY